MKGWLRDVHWLENRDKVSKGTQGGIMVKA